ncbi:transporter substrate-binding domain-containing protein [Propionibacterium australiense]|uniref:Bacterial extracellular solute-binding proteins, family 3 n=1 Tax=Propionibacterium australiense TaxID=119981 RepID=A0A383S3M4_9ACTN|nr:transporter substrate-binding domain-containing protein [Propionibacterium australiense]SYZ32463.1 Bacterial extracellular solute-binding proteins, family 3 [Propionibacterium australiense]VEH90161.1 Glutamine-binding periplasmic protein precursor [Propionibacterium australiense]
MRARGAIAALAAACAVSLTACQSAEEVIAEYSRTDVAGYDTSTVQVDPQVQALVPETVSADGMLTIGSNLYWAPAEFQVGGTPVGYEIDMMRAVARRMGLELSVENAEFDSIMPAIGTKYEAGASSFTITAEREANFNMIQFYFGGIAWATQSGNPTGFDPSDICGRSIGVQTGTMEDDAVNEMAKKCDVQPSVLRYDSQDAVTQALTGGKIEAMSSDSPVIDYAVAKTDGAIATVGEVTAMAPFGVVVRKDDQAMTDAMQAALQSLMDDGTLEQIFAAWGITENIAEQAIVNPEVDE